MFKKIIIAFLIVIIATGIFIFSPTPKFLRNNTVDGVRVEIKVSNDNRLPIVRTLTEEKFLKKNKDDIEALFDKTSGKLEGDIPTVNLLEDKNIYFKFLKDSKQVEPDSTPKIIVISKPSYLDIEEGEKIIEGELTKKDEQYIFEMDRYRTQFEKYFLETNFVNVKFSIDGKNFVSVFTTTSNNAMDGTDFFDNETLENPIDVEK